MESSQNPRLPASCQKFRLGENDLAHLVRQFGGHLRNGPTIFNG